ncbi:MAG: M61 family metallopeptidase [Acidobacteria bacterium]|nr:M61 family metallopeptidase [Acidobacteriota bacterium]
MCVWRGLSRLVFVLLLSSLANPVAAQTTGIEYVVSIPHPEQRWLLVDATFPSRAGQALEVRMARSSPGRYATHEFGKNVYRFEALDAAGAALAVTQVAPAHWRIAATGPAVHVRYRLFADHVDGTYAAVDRTHAHLNIPATFAWAPSLQQTPIRVRLTQPPDLAWRVSTQLFPTGDPLVFTAPNHQYFMDSPIEFSDHAVREFTVARPSGAPARIRLAVHHLGTDAQVDAFAADVEKVVREQAAVFGEIPAFDTGTYTFLMDYLPWADGDGMEHRNSTVCTSSATLADAAPRLLGTVSHEFFHAWNVERIRPASLEPFDFGTANMSGDLWLAEGFTSYYGVLTMIRAGFIAADQGVEQLAGYANGVLHAPGTRFRSAVDMSRLAPFVDAATSVDSTNWENTFASYYTYGAAIGLGLDLTLRERSNGRVTLDDFMRQLWKVHGVPGGKAPGYVTRPYTVKDAEAALAVVSGDAAFAADFFTRHVLGTEAIDYARLFAAVGYALRERGTPPTLGPVRLQQRQGRMVVAGNTIEGSPLHTAGIGSGDAITSLAGTAITQPGDFERILATQTPGTDVAVEFDSRGERRTVPVTVQKNNRLEAVPSSPRTPEQDALRTAWLSSRRPS